MFGPKNRNYVGIDIGADSIKIVCLEKEEGRLVLRRSIVEKSTGDVFDGYKILKTTELGARLKNILKNHHIQAQEVACALPSASVFIKKFIVPMTVSKNKLNNFIAEEAKKCIPYDVNAVNYDCQVLGIAGSLQEMDVLVVAAKRDVVASYIATFEKAGLNLGVIDVTSFAQERAFSYNYSEVDDQRAVIISVGHRSTELISMYQGRAHAYIDCEVGGKLYAESLTEVFQIPIREAEAVFRGEIANVYDKNLYQQTIDNVTKHIITTLIDRLKKQRLDVPFESIEAVYLNGGGAVTNNLLYEFSVKSNLASLQMYAFKNIPSAKYEGAMAEPDKKMSAFMGTAVGLALRLASEEE